MKPEHDGVIRNIQQNFESQELIQEREKVAAPSKDDIVCKAENEAAAEKSINCLESLLMEKESQLKGP